MLRAAVRGESLPASPGEHDDERGKIGCGQVSSQRRWVEQRCCGETRTTTLPAVGPLLAAGCWPTSAINGAALCCTAAPTTLVASSPGAQCVEQAPASVRGGRVCHRLAGLPNAGRADSLPATAAR